MKHVPRADAQRFENGAVTSYEYDIPGAKLNVAPIEISGRYPESGYTSNTESDAIIHVTEGSGVLGMTDGAAVELAVGDQVHLAVGDAYYFEGNLKIIYAATPPWTPQQTEHIE